MEKININKIKYSSIYDDTGKKHICFFLKNYGWFVILKDKKIINHRLHSVLHVNSPVKIKNYIQKDILENRNIKGLMTQFINNLNNNPTNNYHVQKDI